ncbi:MAG: glycoside hydrolase family 2 protein, partial [Boseongicola sp.]
MDRLTEFCRDWVFCEGFEPSWAKSPIEGQRVVIPHTAVELPADYFDESIYQRSFCYQRQLNWDPGFAGKEISFVFDGAMANAQVYADGVLLGGHPDGYTPFEIRLTKALSPQGALITVHIDGTENPNIPPFGGQIDYLTYAGIYREVWLKVVDPVSIKNVKIETPNVSARQKTVKLECHAAIAAGSDIGTDGKWTAEILDCNGTVIATKPAALTGAADQITIGGIEGVDLWTLNDPTLYRLRLTLEAVGSRDVIERDFGFRQAEFAPDGFRLNGRKVKLMGLNRHQSFPYSGYAQGRRSQERDAEILKFDLSCNVVRTSHYPQSTCFLDHCDRIGLMVLEEIPGWQHIGGDVWKDQAVQNVQHMIERDWNHPSIIMWGVRINESDDDDEFYTRTNNLAHSLDATRQTGGIRKHTHSTLLEDVYTFNDFVLGNHELPGENHPRTALRDSRDVTGQARNVPYLITEYNGHMFPTKSFDQEQRQIEHVTRHLEVLNAAFGDDTIAGCIGWCMFDYNTHKDFGSGDRLCHHGVLTQFRQPKFAAHAYGSQGDPRNRVVLEPVTFWARGERNIGGTLPLMILTNCDYVQMRLPGDITHDILPDRANFPNLPHPPAVLNHTDIDPDELGNWGQSWSDVEFVGYLEGQEAARRKMVANPVATELLLEPDEHIL